MGGGVRVAGALLRGIVALPTVGGHIYGSPENIPALAASDWSVVRIYLRFLRPIGRSDGCCTSSRPGALARKLRRWCASVFCKCVAPPAPSMATPPRDARTGARNIQSSARNIQSSARNIQSSARNIHNSARNIHTSA
eukprot:1185720-Prorocentrum_minimum.AAC.5